MTTAEELITLKKLQAEGTITNEQFERACARLQAEEMAAAGAVPHDREDRKENQDRHAPGKGPPGHPSLHAGDDHSPRYDRRAKVREWCMALHLSLLAGHTVALGGIIAPLLIWQLKRKEYPELDAHGRNAVNWLISWVLFMAISVVLCFVFIGIPLLIVGAVLGVVFPVIAGLKANRGEVWEYPLAIRFLK